MIVVSDTGAKLSPNAAPDKIAPARTAGLHPNKMPAGYKIKHIVEIVPNPDPVATANNAEKTNAHTVNTAPDTPSFTETHTSPSTICPLFNMAPYIPTTNHNITAVIATFEPSPFNITSQ